MVFAVTVASFLEVLTLRQMQIIERFENTNIQARIYARAPRRQIFSGGILKKSRLKYGMRKKKAVHEREI